MALQCSRKQTIITCFFDVQAFSFFALLLFIGMIVYFLLAKYVLLWPSHGDEPPAGRKSDSKAEDYAPEE